MDLQAMNLEIDGEETDTEKIKVYQNMTVTYNCKDKHIMLDSNRSLEVPCLGDDEGLVSFQFPDKWPKCFAICAHTPGSNPEPKDGSSASDYIPCIMDALSGLCLTPEELAVIYSTTSTTTTSTTTTTVTTTTTTTAIEEAGIVPTTTALTTSTTTTVGGLRRKRSLVSVYPNATYDVIYLEGDYMIYRCREENYTIPKTYLRFKCLNDGTFKQTPKWHKCEPITTTTTTTTTTTSDNLICPKADLLRHSFEVNKKCHCRFSYCMEHHKNLLPDPYLQENYDDHCPEFAKLVFNNETVDLHWMFAGCAPPADPNLAQEYQAAKFDFNTNTSEPYHADLGPYVELIEDVKCMKTMIENALYDDPNAYIPQAAAAATTTTAAPDSTTTTTVGRKKRETGGELGRISSRRKREVAQEVKDLCIELVTKVRAALESMNTAEKIYTTRSSIEVNIDEVIALPVGNGYCIHQEDSVETSLTNLMEDLSNHIEFQRGILDIVDVRLKVDLGFCDEQPVNHTCQPSPPLPILPPSVASPAAAPAATDGNVTTTTTTTVTTTTTTTATTTATTNSETTTTVTSTTTTPGPYIHESGCDEKFAAPGWTLLNIPDCIIKVTTTTTTTTTTTSNETTTPMPTTTLPGPEEVANANEWIYVNETKTQAPVEETSKRRRKRHGKRIKREVQRVNDFHNNVLTFVRCATPVLCWG